MENLGMEENKVEVEIAVEEPRRKTRRRLVQSTLSRCNFEENVEGEEEGEEYREDKSKKRKRKTQHRASKKEPDTSKKVLNSSTENRNSLASSSKSSSCAGLGSDFFLKVSERRLQYKLQKERHESEDLTSGNSEHHEASESVASKKSCQHLKGKRRGKASPCKKITAATASDVQGQNTSHTVFDLHLEAKIAAEENARLSAGRQPHPFFSSRQTTKRSLEIPETTEADSILDSVLQDGGIVSCPIHVYEALEEAICYLDWKDWLFYEKTVLNSSGYCGSEDSCSSLFDGSVEPLKFDSLVSISTSHGTSSLPREVYLGEPLPVQGGDIYEMSNTTSSMSADGEACGKLLACFKIHEKNNVNLLSGYAACVGNEETRLSPGFLSERMVSCNLQYGNQPRCSLWTTKYQPEKASEVCGNGKSVRFLSEWLQSWRERVPQTYKNSVIDNKDVIQDNDSSSYEDDPNLEDMDEGSILKNVLLVTGPVGSGKSAAIYACAKEQDFQVIEVNASDWRNGAHVKRKFGETMESHVFNKWTLEDSIGMQRNHSLELSSTEKRDSEDLLEGSMTCKQAVRNGTEQFVSRVENKNACHHAANNTLVLFEDVDIIFDEDDGFINAVRRLAQTAKRPMILTRNSKDPKLTQHLEAVAVDFTLPSQEELLSSIYMISAAEEVNISLKLLEQFIGCCRGDIRKTFMLLQFWCQGKGAQEDMNTQRMYRPLQFDLDAGHHVLPKILPWAFPCQLSKVVEEEISKALSKEKVKSIEVFEEEELKSEGLLGTLKRGNPQMESIKARKQAMLSRNGSVHDCTEVLAQVDDVGDLAYASDSPVTFARQNVRHKLSTVLYSDSEEETFCVDDMPAMSDFPLGDPHDELLSAMSEGQSLPCMVADPDSLDPSADQICHSKSGKYEENHFRRSNMANCPQTSSEFMSLVTSFVPNSSFVPETEIGEARCPSKMLSTGHYAGTSDDVSMRSPQSFPTLPMAVANSPDRNVVEPDKHSSAVLQNSCALDTESFDGNEQLGESHNENADAVTEGYPVMDECSRADFRVGSVPVSYPKCHDVVYSVQEAWRMLRSRREALKSYVTPEQQDIHMIKLASGLTDLISVADVMFRSCQPLIYDSVEPSLLPLLEPDMACWYDDQLEMTSTVAEHGFCLYTKKAASLGSNLGCENKVDLAREMLACSTNTMALGKLVTEQMSMTQNSCKSRVEAHRTTIPLIREIEPKLYDTVLSIVPEKLHLALKGDAFEYLTILSQISRSEASRLSKSISTTKQRNRRARVACNYLSSGVLALSSQYVQLLAQHGNFGD